MTKKKSNRQKRTLVGALCVAAVIMAGSTFAWFTSQDEVTNRLTASGNYGVDLIENFTPPNDDWTPGQKVTKEVQALNTGNVDAYAKIALESVFTVVLEDTNGIATDAQNLETAGIRLGNLAATDASYGADATALKESYALQAGGALIYAAGKTVADVTATNVEGGKAAIPDQTATTKYGISQGAWLVDADTFTPDKTGLYIFRREIETKATGTSYAYAGYYFVADTTKENGKGTFYALTMESSANTDDLTVKGLTVTAKDAVATIADGEPTWTVSIDNVKVRAKKTITTDVAKTGETAAVDGAITYKYVKPAENADSKTGAAKWQDASGLSEATAIRVTFDPTYAASSYTNDPANDTVVYILLDATGKANWLDVGDLNGTGVTDDSDFGWFLYNAVIKPGETSSKLISAIQMGEEVQNKAFLDLTYDLNIKLDSVQAIKQTNGGADYSNETLKTWTKTVASGTGASYDTLYDVTATTGALTAK